MPDRDEQLAQQITGGQPPVPQGVPDIPPGTDPDQAAEQIGRRAGFDSDTINIAKQISAPAGLILKQADNQNIDLKQNPGATAQIAAQIAKLQGVPEASFARSAALIEKANADQPLSGGEGLALLFATILPVLAGAALGGKEGAFAGIAGAGEAGETFFEGREREDIRRDRTLLTQAEEARQAGVDAEKTSLALEARSQDINLSLDREQRQATSALEAENRSATRAFELETRQAQRDREREDRQGKEVRRREEREDRRFTFKALFNDEVAQEKEIRAEKRIRDKEIRDSKEGEEVRRDQLEISSELANRASRRARTASNLNWARQLRLVEKRAGIAEGTATVAFDRRLDVLDLQNDRLIKTENRGVDKAKESEARELGRVLESESRGAVRDLLKRKLDSGEQLALEERQKLERLKAFDRAQKAAVSKMGLSEKIATAKEKREQEFTLGRDRADRRFKGKQARQKLGLGLQKEERQKQEKRDFADYQDGLRRQLAKDGQDMKLAVAKARGEGIAELLIDRKITLEVFKEAKIVSGTVSSANKLLDLIDRGIESGEFKKDESVFGAMGRFVVGSLSKNSLSASLQRGLMLHSIETTKPAFPGSLAVQETQWMLDINGAKDPRINIGALRDILAQNNAGLIAKVNNQLSIAKANFNAGTNVRFLTHSQRTIDILNDRFGLEPIAADSTIMPVDGQADFDAAIERLNPGEKMFIREPSGRIGILGKDGNGNMSLDRLR